MKNIENLNLFYTAYIMRYFDVIDLAIDMFPFFTTSYIFIIIAYLNKFFKSFHIERRKNEYFWLSTYNFLARLVKYFKLFLAFNRKPKIVLLYRFITF